MSMSSTPNDIIVLLHQCAQGLVKGLNYGTKIRLPHALVMTLLYKRGAIRSMLRSILRVTWQHSRNLAYFVGLYKFMFRLLHEVAGCKPLHTSKPLSAVLGGVAGAVGASMVWASPNAVSVQLSYYLLGRLGFAVAKLLASKVPTLKDVTFQQGFPFASVAIWAMIMAMFEGYEHSLAGSLRTSMVALYRSPAKASLSLKQLLPSPAACAVLVLVFGMGLLRKDRMSLLLPSQ